MPFPLCLNLHIISHPIRSFLSDNTMPHSETSALLPRQNGDRNYDGLPPTNRLSAFLKSEGQPGWFSSLRWFFLGSWLNIFLVFVPLCIVAEKAQWDVLYRFSFSFLAIVPLAKVRLSLHRVRHGWLIHVLMCSCWAMRQNRLRSELVRFGLGFSTPPLEMLSRLSWASPRCSMVRLLHLHSFKLDLINN